jgi:hypothetical protein
MKLKVRTCLYIFALSLIVWACDNSLEPLDMDAGVYSIFGTLDLNKETNYIRVRDLNVPFTAEATRELNAVVTLENPGSGTVDVLESERLEHEGVYHHNFVVNGAIQPDTEYILTVERPDGVTITLSEITPTMPEPVINSFNTDCYTPIEVEFSPTNGGTIVYRIRFRFELFGTYFSAPRALRSNGNNQGKLSFTFTPIKKIPQLAGNPPPPPNTRCHHMATDNLTVFYSHYGPGLYEKIENDPFDIMRSTERFGGFYVDSLEIPIDTSRVCPPDCTFGNQLK